MIRYHGVFASRHHLRAAIADRDPNATASVVQLPLLERHGQEERPAKIRSSPPPPARLAWSRLLARVFSIDVTICPECGGRMKILKAVLLPEDIDEALARQGLLEPRGSPPAPTPTGQTDLPWTA